MQKTRFINLFIFVFVALSLFISPNVRAEIVCPAGYVCTKVTDTALQCPFGYVCTPIKTSSQSSVVISPSKANVYYVGENLNIKWNDVGGRDVENYEISLISPSLSKTIANNVRSASSGVDSLNSYQWLISDIEDGENYRILIRRKGLDSTPIISETFSIRSTNTLVSVFVDGPQKLNIKWKSHAGNFDYYRVSIVNSSINKEIELGTKIDKSKNALEVSVPSTFLDLLENNYSAKNSNYIKVNSIRNYWYGPSLVKSATSSPFKIGNNDGAPVISSISPSSGPIGTKVEIKGENLSGFEGDLDVYFEDASGQKVKLTDNSGTYPKTMGKSMVIMVKEPCQRGEKIIGRYSGIESWCNYVPLKPGNYKVYVNPYGVKSNVVSFTVTSENNYTSVPSSTPSPTPGIPSVLFNYPRGSETWNVGETKNISWTYKNFNLNKYGYKFVDLVLGPTDGRAPVVLSTFEPPYGSTSLKIYTKTSDGRDAWLPGQYKLKLACRNTNADGFRTCVDTVPGYITVVNPSSPTPTPVSNIPVSVDTSNMNNLNASIWSAVDQYLKNSR